MSILSVWYQLWLKCICEQCLSCPGGGKRHTPEALPVSNQGDSQKAPHQVAETPAPPLSRLTYASMRASVKQPFKPSVQDTCYTDSSSARSLTHDMYSETPSSNSTQLSESALAHSNTASSQWDTPPLLHVRDNSLRNSPTGSNGRGSIDSQRIRPMIRLSTLENMNHAQ